MLTFYDMGSTGAIDAGRIMTGLSLALKATALGLAVAIPTLISYNGLQPPLLRRRPLPLLPNPRFSSWAGTGIRFSVKCERPFSPRLNVRARPAA